MICPACPKCNSEVTENLSTVSWYIPYKAHHDRNGKLHIHNPNKIFYDFKCDKGHVFETSAFFKCMQCGWQAENA